MERERSPGPPLLLLQADKRTEAKVLPGRRYGRGRSTGKPCLREEVPGRDRELFQAPTLQCTSIDSPSSCAKRGPSGRVYAHCVAALGWIDKCKPSLLSRALSSSLQGKDWHCYKPLATSVPAAACHSRVKKGERERECVTRLYMRPWATSCRTRRQKDGESEWGKDTSTYDEDIKSVVSLYLQCPRALVLVVERGEPLVDDEHLAPDAQDVRVAIADPRNLQRECKMQ